MLTRLLTPFGRSNNKNSNTVAFEKQNIMIFCKLFDIFNVLRRTSICWCISSRLFTFWLNIIVLLFLIFTHPGFRIFRQVFPVLWWDSRTASALSTSRYNNTITTIFTTTLLTQHHHQHQSNRKYIIFTALFNFLRSTF